MSFSSLSARNDGDLGRRKRQEAEGGGKGTDLWAGSVGESKGRTGVLIALLHVRETQRGREGEKGNALEDRQSFAVHVRDLLGFESSHTFCISIAIPHVPFDFFRMPIDLAFGLGAVLMLPSPHSWTPPCRYARISDFLTVSPVESTPFEEFSTLSEKV